ncbi:DUF4238 domain-containing protein [Microbacterium stercoris]|uniref:DUF4238 domain-containing protein n=1 Tax=Microbacterium stercoris TaxID=2820289 RepID=A0A939QS21_9MICO|nr:DUF4238 domain-containing protein [Microbacterium stercoris]MBO3664073.1 DUF4238 domain-containing protein [Microbacterium stercoris]
MAVKRAHMITRGYLEAWSNERGLVHVWDAEHEINKPQSLTNATVVSYGYQTTVTSFDLEGYYAEVESQAIPALRSLATGGAPDSAGRSAIVSFLDMHLERGRYADQTKVKVPVWMGSMTEPGRMAEMALGDRLTFARDVDTEAIRLDRLRVERWTWRVVNVQGGLVTGDGAVLLFRKTHGAPLSAVTFPLSPTRLLIIGDGLPGIHPQFNLMIASKCRRWLVDHVDGAVARTFGFR